MVKDNNDIHFVLVTAILMIINKSELFFSVDKHPGINAIRWES